MIYNGKEAKEFSWDKGDFYFIDKPCKKRNPGYPLDSISIIPKYNKYFVELTEKKYQDMVLKFVKKYGLLGELMYIPINKNILHERKVYKQGINNIEIESLEKYLQQFFKADNKIDFNKELTIDDLYYLQGFSSLPFSCFLFRYAIWINIMDSIRICIWSKDK